MALNKKDVINEFKEILTELETFEAQGHPPLSAEQIAEKMSDWIIASSVESTVHFMKKLPTKPEAGKIYLLPTGQYIIHNPEGKPFKGSLLDISTIPDEIADNTTKKLKSPQAIEKLKTQLLDLQSNRKNPEFIVHVVKITTKMGHNPFDMQKLNAVKNKCHLVLHPDKLSAQDNPIKKYLIDNRTLANNESVPSDFYMKAVNDTLGLQPKPSTVGKLLYAAIVFATFLAAIAIASLFYAAIGALVYLTAIEFFEAFVMWAVSDIVKALVIVPIIQGLSSFFFSQKHAIMIGATCGMILSAALAYQFIIMDFAISAIMNIISIKNFAKIFIAAANSPEPVAPNPEVNNQANAAPDLEHADFITKAYKKAQEKVNAPDADLPPPVVKPKSNKSISPAFENAKKKKPNAAAENDEQPSRRRSLSPARSGNVDADALD